MCNVVFLFDSMKNCENTRIFKIHENLVNIGPRVQAISVLIDPQKDKVSIEGVQRRVFVRIDEKM